jgi:hypothetical protein
MLVGHNSPISPYCLKLDTVDEVIEPLGNTPKAPKYRIEYYLDSSAYHNAMDVHSSA